MSIPWGRIHGIDDGSVDLLKDLLKPDAVLTDEHKVIIARVYIALTKRTEFPRPEVSAKARSFDQLDKLLQDYGPLWIDHSDAHGTFYKIIQAPKGFGETTVGIHGAALIDTIANADDKYRPTTQQP